MADSEKIRATADAYVAALNASDAAAMAGIYAENATLEDPVGGGTIHEGIAAIREFYDNLAPLKIDATLHEARVCGNELLFNFEITTHFDENSKATINVWDHMAFDEDNKVVSMRAFWGPENMS